MIKVRRIGAGGVTQDAPQHVRILTAAMTC
jgi:hypothetical protein